MSKGCEPRTVEIRSSKSKGNLKRGKVRSTKGEVRKTVKMSGLVMICRRGGRGFTSLYEALGGWTAALRRRGADGGLRWPFWGEPAGCGGVEWDWPNVRAPSVTLGGTGKLLRPRAAALRHRKLRHW